mgnify:CR=1 FL=1
MHIVVKTSQFSTLPFILVRRINNKYSWSAFLFTFKEIIPLQRTNILLVQPTGQMEILISVTDCSCLYHTLIFVEQVYAIHKISVKLQDLLIMKLNKKWKTPVNCYSYKGKDTWFNIMVTLHVFCESTVGYKVCTILSPWFMAILVIRWKPSNILLSLY